MNAHTRRAVTAAEQARADLTLIARDCLDTAGDIEAAVPALLRRIGGDTALMAALTDGQETTLARALLRRLSAARRTRAFALADRAAARADTPSRDAAVAALVRGNMAALFDVTLPSGRKLTAATRAEVAEAAQYYNARGRTMLARGRWFESLAARMDDAGKTVSETFDEATLADLLKQAEEAE
jgi:hypothetical protein